MEKLVELSLNEVTQINGGSILPNDFRGSWWCVFCWIDYAYQ